MPALRLEVFDSSIAADGTPQPLVEASALEEAKVASFEQGYSRRLGRCRRRAAGRPEPHPGRSCAQPAKPGLHLSGRPQPCPAGDPAPDRWR